MLSNDLCLHCQIKAVFAESIEEEERKHEERRAGMSEFDLYLDKAIEQLLKDSYGRAFHRLMYGEFYGPAGSPNASVGYEKPDLCFCKGHER